MKKKRKIMNTKNDKKEIYSEIEILEYVYYVLVGKTNKKFYKRQFLFFYFCVLFFFLLILLQLNAVLLFIKLIYEI